MKYWKGMRLNYKYSKDWNFDDQVILFLLNQSQ